MWDRAHDARAYLTVDWDAQVGSLGRVVDQPNFFFARG